MPSYEWDRGRGAFIKECVGCNEIFVGTPDREESEAVFAKHFGMGGASNLDGLQTSCNLCRAGRNYGYSITHTQKRALYEAQKGICPICLGELAYDKARIDHCHVTGRIRGLLHTPCNSQLGFYEKHGDRIKKYIGET